MTASYNAQAEADIKFGYCTEFIILLTKNFNIKIDEDVFTIGKRKSIFAKALYYDRYNY